MVKYQGRNSNRSEAISVTTLVVTIFTWIHLLGVIGWLGSLIVWSAVVDPLLGRLSQQSKEELVIKVFPRLTRLTDVTGDIGLGFGLLLALTITNGNIITTVTSAWGLSITVAAAFGLVGFVISHVGVVETGRKMVKLLNDSQGARSDEVAFALASAEKRMKRLAPTSVAFLLIAFTLMIIAGTL